MILVGLTFLGFFPLRCLKMFKDTLRVIIRFLLWRLISAASDLKVTELEASKHIVLRLVLDSHHFVVFSVSLLCRHAAGGRGQLLGCFRLLIMYIEQREAGRRIFIPSFVLGVHAILVLLKHTERDNHGGQFQRFANRITGRVSARSCGCGFAWTLSMNGSGAEENLMKAFIYVADSRI